MLCNEIGWHDLQIRQVSGKFTDCAVQFANWLANLPIGRLADWTEEIYVMYSTYYKEYVAKCTRVHPVPDTCMCSGFLNHHTLLLKVCNRDSLEALT